MRRNCLAIWSRAFSFIMFRYCREGSRRKLLACLRWGSTEDSKVNQSSKSWAFTILAWLLEHMLRLPFQLLSILSDAAAAVVEKLLLMKLWATRNTGLGSSIKISGIKRGIRISFSLPSCSWRIYEVRRNRERPNAAVPRIHHLRQTLYGIITFSHNSLISLVLASKHNRNRLMRALTLSFMRPHHQWSSIGISLQAVNARLHVPSYTRKHNATRGSPQSFKFACMNHSSPKVIQLSLSLQPVSNAAPWVSGRQHIVHATLQPRSCCPSCCVIILGEDKNASV